MSDLQGIQNTIGHYYNQGREEARLLGGTGQLERARSQELLLRHLPPAPATVLDIGGGAGIYSFWLAELGYHVHLIDVMPLHIEQARAQSEKVEKKLAGANVGDARKLDFPDESADVVLLMGPLYHLTERADRVAVLREAERVVRPGGLVVGVGISRFASLIDGLVRDFLSDPYFRELVVQDLRDGQHRNPTQSAGYFTSAYFHHPDEFPGEFQDAGLEYKTTLAIEGIGGVLQNFEAMWADPARRELILYAVRQTEAEPTLIGASSHMMAIGYAPR